MAEDFQADRRLFIATCRPFDQEMRDRIARHQRERDAGWETLEIPLELAPTLETCNAPGNIVLVDCLTLWLTNLMLTGPAESDLEKSITKLTRSLTAMRCPVILVSNEVGQGIVPENRLARQFRDWAGQVNQGVAQCADQVFWMVSGIAVKIK